MQTLLKGARVFIGNGFKLSDVLIEDGRIVSISEGQYSSCADGMDGVCVYDLTDKYIFPGLVDVHVHFREPGFSYKETIETGSKAAAAGGYTDVCTMPNLDPVPDSPETLQVELDAIKKNIRDTYPTEIYFTLVDEAERPVKLTLTETSREYIIPVFTDMREYAIGSAKISKLFLDKLELKVITPEDIADLAEADEHFEGFVINPHSQNFNMNRNGDF